jgi:hypothetical protein
LEVKEALSSNPHPTKKKEKKIKTENAVFFKQVI